MAMKQNHKLPDPFHKHDSIIHKHVHESAERAITCRRRMSLEPNSLKGNRVRAKSSGLESLAPNYVHYTVISDQFKKVWSSRRRLSCKPC